MTRTRWLGFVALMVGAMMASETAVAASKAKRPRPPPEPTAPDVEGVEQIDVGTRDVLERLKLLRVQMALDREEIAALQLRIAKLKLEREFETLAGGGQKTASARKPKPVGNDIIVKAISLQPHKEAVIMYRGRIYTVRPGDRIGNVVIADITDSGIRLKGGKSAPR